MRFMDDEDVVLDCGCTATAGDDYTVDTFEVCEKTMPVFKSNMMQVTYSHCDSVNCMCQMYESIFDKYMAVSFVDTSEEHVNTAYENESEYADFMED